MMKYGIYYYDGSRDLDIEHANAVASIGEMRSKLAPIVIVAAKG